jgi:uncharacterized tellurite resistance protein B-like protein
MEELASYTRQDRIQFCRVIANIVAADHKVTEEEQVQLAGLVWQAGLSMFEEDVAAAINEELQNPSPLRNLVGGLQNANLRRWVYRVTVELAYADGELASVERDKILELADIFDLNRQAAEDLIQWTYDSINLESREADIMSRL